MMTRNLSRPHGILVFWLCWCAFCDGTGWGLSAIHLLNGWGYAVSFVLGAFAWWRWPRAGRIPAFPRMNVRKLRARFRRLFPLSFLVLAALAILGGLLHPPNNYDALTYRIPRVLHWLAEGHWKWIHTPDCRMNTRCVGFEWLTAPLFALSRSDRLIFLPNVISFLLLPGLVFSVFTRLGVARRVAWHWMWLVPAGFNFSLQAASATNDLFGAVFALAALDFALRAREGRRLSDVWFSILAAALLTGAKASNLPLLLPCFIALWFSFPLLLARPAASLAVLLVATFSSFVPNAALNAHYCGDWTGSVLEAPRFRIHKPLLGIVGNALTFGLNCPSLPVMPLPKSTGEKLARGMVPARFLESFDHSFANPFGAFWGSGIQTEDGAGLGFGFSFLLVASAIAAWTCRRHSGAIGVGSVPTMLLPLERRLLLASPWVSLLVYFANAGMGQEGRLLTPYYPLLLPLLLAGPAQRSVVRRSWWRWCAILTFFMAASLLIMSPARPLVPAWRLLHRWGSRNAFLARSEAAYLANAHRYDGLGPVRDLLPDGIERVGFVSSGNDIEPSLWRPFGQRRVEYVLPGDTQAGLRQIGLRYVVLGGEALRDRGQSLDSWLKAYHAEKVGQLVLTRTFPPYVPVDWYVVKTVE